MMQTDRPFYRIYWFAEPGHLADRDTACWVPGIGPGLHRPDRPFWDLHDGSHDRQALEDAVRTLELEHEGRRYMVAESHPSDPDDLPADFEP